MHWFTQLFFGSGIAQSIVALSLTVVLGLALGRISIGGVRLGVGGVLFSGLALAHFGFSVQHEILEFAREFGLILFVFSVGMQVGPGFVDSLRRRGLFLNIAAALIVLLGVLTTVAVFLVFKLPLPAAVGLFSGAVTNTPSLAASSQVFSEILPDTAAAAVAEAGMGYAVAYPFGILGIILTMLLIRACFRISPERELRFLRKLDALRHPPLQTRSFYVSNPNIFGMPLRDFLALYPLGMVISRVLEPQGASAHVPTAETVLSEGMLVTAVGTARKLDKLRPLLGPESAECPRDELGRLVIRKLVVTQSKAAGKSVKGLGLTPEFGVTVTRIHRAGVEFTAGPGVHLHYGDRLICVGEEQDIARAAATVGNSEKALDHPHVMPIFLGILLGVILGSIPIPLPGLPSGLKLGIAGGPLLVAIFLGRINHFRGLIWYLPLGANLIMREVGIALFLACVGLNSGPGFVHTLVQGQGLLWMAAGACITFIPLVLVAVPMRAFFRYDYPSICGLLAGSMTDPPALAFSVQSLGSDAPASVYATVYPLTMMLRILLAQLLVLGLYHLG
ncbi:putative transporter [Desulfovibrio sp. OttesenSCG-928-A18]|nr:putative transporter [Desulfovibrio sp. OttesenSCG-928-A18]